MTSILRITSRTKALTVTLLCLGAATACDSVESPTNLDAPSLAVGDLVFDDTATSPGVGTACVIYPYPGGYGPSTLSASATEGDLIEGDFQIEWPCLEVWNATSDAGVDLTVSLLDNPGNVELDRIATAIGDGDLTFHEGGEASVTVPVSDLVGAVVWFKFKFADVPETEGGEGCTPGYWRQSHHFDSWTDYAPTDLFSSVFVDAFPGQTLGDVVWARGGGLNALGRMAVAALLNASSNGVSYDYTAGEVVELFNSASSSGDRRAIEYQKDVFDLLNNQGCGLN